MKRYILAASWALAAAAHAQPGTSWTYQGTLQNAGQPGTGLHDFRFRLYDAATGGTQVGLTQCADNVDVAAGVFTVVLDFGAQFPGAARFLEIDVRQDTGLNCGNATGFVTLGTRQPITPTPYAMFAAQATAASNATNLNGQPASFYTNATNLTAGTLPDARLTANVTLLGSAQTFTGVKTFSAAPAFTAAAAPFTVSSTTRVTNLNADLLDGLDSTAFAPSSHTHDATAITTGTLADARLSSNIPRLNAPANFTSTGSFGGRVTASEASATGGTFQGTHTGTLLNQYGVFGLASATGTSSAVGVRGESRGNTGAGLYGVATTTSGQAYGVVGLASSTNTESAGVYGESSAANAVYGFSIAGRGLFGRSDSGFGAYAQTTTGNVALYAVRTANNNRGWFGGVSEGGWSESPAGTGFVARTTTGGMALYGLRTANNNRGWFGGASEGGWAESPAGTGFVARTTTGAYALYAERNPGGSPTNVNRGWFGGAGEGAWAESDQGNGLVALSRGLNAAAVYCRNDAGGRALFADGVAAVRALDILGGADLAEPFHVSGEPAPGMVVCIDPDAPGHLRIAGTAYDTTVAGIISGANGLSPAMVMRAEGNPHADGQHVVAMTGRVWCFADASDAEIRPGDRLTTSDTPGHAMRVRDEARAPGAVIGKAMTPLPKGERGLVLVLVNLQ
jgi:hypothetical protein